MISHRKRSGLIDPYSFSNSSISLVFTDENPERKPKRNRYKGHHNEVLLKNILNEQSKKMKKPHKRGQSVGRYDAVYRTHDGAAASRNQVVDDAVMA